MFKETPWVCTDRMRFFTPCCRVVVIDSTVDQCRYPECFGLRYGDNPYCHSHTTSVCGYNGCYYMRHETSLFCRHHIPERCSHSDCPIARYDGSRFCQQHQEIHVRRRECVYTGCHRRRVENTEYCAHHKCDVSRCPKPAVSEHRCEDHPKCTYRGCDRVRVVSSRGARLDFCERRE
jgi:hypothetical protein